MRTSRPRPSRDGSALVAVLWLIAILSLAAISAIRVVSFDVELATSQIHGFRARQLAEMGIAIGANPTVQKKTDPLLRQYSEETGEGFEVRLISEGGKFNINVLLLRSEELLLKGIFIDWGMTIDEAQALVDALIDWIDPNDDIQLNGAEKDWYLEQGRLNQPFNRPFYNIEEMRLVRGMDYLEALKPDWREWFTIWSSGQLDLNEAKAELIAAVFDIPLEVADEIPKIVSGPDGIRDTEDDKPFTDIRDALAVVGVDPENTTLTARVTVNEATTRIESIGSVAGARRKIVVIVRNRTGRPAVLERTEEVMP